MPEAGAAKPKGGRAQPVGRALQVSATKGLSHPGDRRRPVAAAGLPALVRCGRSIVIFSLTLNAIRCFQRAPHVPRELCALTARCAGTCTTAGARAHAAMTSSAAALASMGFTEELPRGRFGLHTRPTNLLNREKVQPDQAGSSRPRCRVCKGAAKLALNHAVPPPRCACRGGQQPAAQP